MIRETRGEGEDDLTVLKVGPKETSNKDAKAVGQSFRCPTEVPSTSSESLTPKETV